MAKEIIFVKELKVGHRFTYPRLGTVEIVEVHDFGTVDVVTVTGRNYRISGLLTEVMQPWEIKMGGLPE